MQMEKAAGAPGKGNGRGRGCRGGSKHHRHPLLLKRTGVEKRHGAQVEKYDQAAESDFFFAALGQTAAWARLVYV